MHIDDLRGAGVQDSPTKRVAGHGDGGGYVQYLWQPQPAEGEGFRCQNHATELTLTYLGTTPKTTG